MRTFYPKRLTAHALCNNSNQQPTDLNTNSARYGIGRRGFLVAALGATSTANALTLLPAGSDTVSVAPQTKLSRTIDLLDALSDAEKADVLTGENSIDITSKIAQFLSKAPAGATLDARALNRTVTWTSSPFAGLPSLPVTLLTGNVTIKANFNLFNFRLPSNFEWNMAGTTITPSVKLNAIRSDTSPATGMVETYISSGTCSGTGGTPRITVSSASGIYPGAAIGILGINAYAPITHTLGVSISASDNSFKFGESTASTINGSLVYIKIDDEIMRVIVTNGVAAVQQRGALGTNAAAHSISASAVLMNTKVFKVVSVSGLVVTTDAPMPFTFKNSTFRAGAIGVKITGSGLIDGAYNPADPPSGIWHCLSTTLGTNCSSEAGLKISRGVHGGLILFGARECNFQVGEITNCGNVANGFGGSLWIFGQNLNNFVNVLKISSCNSGPLIDDKSSGVSGYGIDQPGSGNRITVGRITDCRIGYDITGCTNNTIDIAYCDVSAHTGGIFTSGSQTVTPNIATGNSVTIGFEKTPRKPTGNSLAGNQIVIAGKAIAIQ